MNLVCTFDESYVQHAGVMLCSLFENNPRTTFRVFIVTDGLSATATDQLHQLAAAYGQRLELRKIEAKTFDGCPVTGHISVASYFRLLLPRVLPPEVGRVLFLDSDIVVRRPIAELYDQPLDGYTHAAIANPFCQSDLERLDIPLPATYFNAGVLLVNLRLWRDEGLVDTFLTYARANAHRLLWHDQDTLNGTLHGRWRQCPPTWNAQPLFFKTFSPAELEVSEPELIEAKTNPRIVHFSGSCKPWSCDDRNPFERDYFKYLGKTPWRGYRRPAPTVRERIAGRVRSMVSRIATSR